MTLLQSTNEVNLALHDLGGEGPPLLWCHATGFHGRVYAPVADLVADRHHWAVDFRGFGDSSEPTGALAWSGFGDDVLVVVDHLRSLGHDGPLQAVGHSMGGAAIVLAELDRPGTFDKAFVFEPIIFPTIPEGSTGGPPLADGARKRRPNFASFDAAIERYGSRPPLGLLDPACLARYVRDGFDERDGEVWIKARPAFEAATYESAGHGAFARLGDVTTTIAVAGSGDGAGPALFAPMVADALPNGSFLAFEHLTHFGPIQAPAEIATAVNTFLG